MMRPSIVLYTLGVDKKGMRSVQAFKHLWARELWAWELGNGTGPGTFGVAGKAEFPRLSIFQGFCQSLERPACSRPPRQGEL